jgi:alkaline phosphatase/alkaline phosphatase D
VILLPSARGIQTAIALLLMSLVLTGCQTGRVEPAPDLPHDPQAHTPFQVPETTEHWQGEMAGEVTRDSVILQARLSVKGTTVFGDIKGRPGIGAFALSTDEDFQDAFRTRWMTATPEGDYILKTMVTDLEPGTRYYFKLLSGPDLASLQAGPIGTFRTSDGPGVARETSLVVVTSMQRYSFRATVLTDLDFKRRALGFPSLEAIVAHDPDFVVATGDNVYYDCPSVGRARTREEMRAKWHKQFATPRFAALFQSIPVYWMKDDHDYRYDDADRHGAIEPSAELGAEIFLEQVPVVGPEDENAATYRTHRVNDLLQIWLLESRDYRDPNTKPPGPDKTLWGTGQRTWLKQTLLESDATFKLILSPTPLIGPDDAMKEVQGGVLAPLFGGRAIGQAGDKRKRDNHTNSYGFKDEADAFFEWLVENGLRDENLTFICGDRHWQYHSIHPRGFEEFSAGAIIDGSARLGPQPGDRNSTDPDGLISQPYRQEEASGGFLEVTVAPPTGETSAQATFTFYDEQGVLLHSVEKPAH